MPHAQRHGQMHTNRGRAFEVVNKGRIRKRLTRIVEKDVSAAPGTAVTGFYGVRVTHSPDRPLYLRSLPPCLFRNGKAKTNIASLPVSPSVAFYCLSRCNHGAAPRI